ncbi:MAG: hypothetical protein QOF36_1790 [Microbacteriaceae bacterium]|jgi:AcrR family transcriptional regulator|nr:hypothetical protein [Microbacteriaceae bacterium]
MADRRLPSTTGTAAGSLPRLESPPRGADVTRERLLQAAHELLFERSGGNVSVSEICDRASVNVAMVRYCFGSKNGMLDALVERVTGSFTDELDVLAAADLSSTVKLRRHVGAIVRNYVRFPYLNRLLSERFIADREVAERLSRVFAAPTRAWHERLLEEGLNSGEFRAIDPTFFFFSVIGLCEFLFAARPWLEHGFQATLDEELLERFVEHSADLVLSGVRAVGK